MPEQPDPNVYKRQSTIAFVLTTVAILANLIVQIRTGRLTVADAALIFFPIILPVAFWLFLAPRFGDRIRGVFRRVGKFMIHPWTRHIASLFIVLATLRWLNVLENVVLVLVFLFFVVTLPPRQTLK